MNLWVYWYYWKAFNKKFFYKFYFINFGPKM